MILKELEKNYEKTNPSKEIKKAFLQSESKNEYLVLKNEYEKLNDRLNELE